MITLTNDFQLGFRNSLGTTPLPQVSGGVFTTGSGESQHAVRFRIGNCKGHRILASADVLASDTESAKIYFRVFRRDGSRIDTGSDRQYVTATKVGEWVRLVASLDMASDEASYVDVEFGKFYKDRENGNEHQYRYPCVQIEALPGVRGQLTPQQEVRFGTAEQGGYFVGSRFRFWRQLDVDISDPFGDVSSGGMGWPLGIPNSQVLGAGFAVVQEGLLEVDAEHISSIFVRYSPENTRRWTYYNSNPKPTSRVIPMIFWAEAVNNTSWLQPDFSSNYP